MLLLGFLCTKPPSPNTVESKPRRGVHVFISETLEALNPEEV